MELKKLNVLVHLEYQNGDATRPCYKVTFMYSDNEESFKRISECNNAIQDAVVKHLTNWRLDDSCEDYRHLYFDACDKSLVYGAEAMYNSRNAKLVFDTIQAHDDYDQLADIDSTMDLLFKALPNNAGKMFCKVADGEMFEIVPDEEGYLPEISTFIG